MSASVTNRIKGQLIGIQVNLEKGYSSQSIPVEYLLYIKGDNGVDYTCSINGTKFTRDVIQRLGLPSPIRFKLQAGRDPLTPGEDGQIQNLELNVIGELQNSATVANNRVQLSNLMLDPGINPKPEPEPDSRYLTPAPENWPDPDPDLPFVPIRVPVPRNKPFTRIGYAVFDNPINYITQSRTTQIDQLPAMRLPGTIKKGVGKAYESYSISYIAQGEEEIEKSVREVLEQISLTPFTTVEGGPFGLRNEEGAINHKAIAIRNFSISTIDGYPNALQVEISFDPFNWQYYVSMSDNEIAPVNEFDDVLCWPLIKVWSKRAQRSIYNGQSFSGKFGLYFPTESGAQIIDQIFAQTNSLLPYNDESTLISFENILSSEEGAQVTSRDIKEVQDPTSNVRVFVLKVGSKEVYDKFVNSEFCWGLTTWDKLSASNLYDHMGRFIPESSLINPGYFTELVSGFVPTQGQHASGIAEKLDRYIDIPKPITAEKLRSYLQATGQNELSIVEASNNPQQVFGLVLYADGPTMHERLRTLVGNLSKTAQAQELGPYQTRDDQVRKALFTHDKGEQGIDYSVPALEVGAGGNDENIIVERIGGSRGHNLATLSPRKDPLPVHQYMGGMDATLVVQGKCFGLEAKRKLEQIKEEFDNRAISKKSNKFNLSIDQARKGESAVASFLYVDNEIFHLLGVQFAMPVTLQFESLDQQPDVWNFTLSFIEYNPELKRAEEIKFLNTSWQKLGRIFNYGWNFSSDAANVSQNPIIDKAIEFFEVQGELARQEVYPDMYLPTIGELKYWIKAIYKGAKAWDAGLLSGTSFNSGKGVTVSNPTKGGRATVLTQREAEIVSIVAQDFYPEASTRIVRFWDPKVAGYAGLESSAYAEPDFYTWYHPLESLGNIFDKLTEHQLGKRGQSLSAEGRAVSGAMDNSITGYYRETDSEYDVTAMYSPEHYAANAIRYPIDREINDIMENKLLPPENAQKAKEAIKAAENTIDKTPGAWWVAIENRYAKSTFGEEKYFYLSDSQADTMAEVYSQASDYEEANLNPTAADKTDFLNTELAHPDFRTYFTIDWRQDQLKRSTSQLSRYQVLADDLKRWGEYNTQFFIKDKNTLYDERLADSRMSDLQNAIRINIQNWADDTSETMANAPRSTQIILQLNLGFETAPNWIVRSALISANFRNYKPRQLPSTFNTGLDGMYDTWSEIDSLGMEYQIDPHIIRAVFMRRDGFGSFKPEASIDNGFGDMSISGSSSNVIKEWCKLYAKYAEDLYNIPSIVLLCMNLKTTEIAKEYRDQNGEIKKDIYEAIKTSASNCNRNRYSKQGTQAIAEILNRYPEAGNSIDQYYAAYISMCRTFGSYDANTMDKWRDPYFHGYNLLNVIDTDTNTETIVATFCPTNNKAGVGIRMNRGAASTLHNDPFTEDMSDNYDKNQSSIDLEAALSMKMRGAIDPHSECALYGSLIDMRTHAPFGKLRGAFPAFQILLTNEGFFWSGGNKKLWDQFYTRTGVASIEVHRSRHMPGSTASITFSNMFHNITAYALMEAIADKSARTVHEKIGEEIKRANFFGMISEIWNMLVIKNVPEDARKIWQNNQLKRLALSAGTRIQIRMGYGSNAAKLPIVFNGTVIDAPVSDGYVTLTAVSDGHQLEKPTTTKLVGAGSSYAFQDGGILGTGSDPSLIIKHSLIAATWWDNLTGGNFRDHSSGVSNFGEVIFEGALRYSAEVEFNIYSSRRTKIESGIGELSRFNLVNGIVNWENEYNLFSVSVQEPTPWKIMEVCRRACPDFVAAAEPFALRSTAFFGKWWWPYHFTYSSSILKLVANPLVNTVYSLKENELMRSPDGTKALQVAEESKSIYWHNVSFAKESDKLLILAEITRILREQNDSIDNVYKIEAVARAFHVYSKTLKRYVIMQTGINPDNTPVWSLLNTESIPEDRFTAGTKEAEAILSDTVIPKETKYGRVMDYDTWRATIDKLKDVSTLQMHLRWKPYMQAYIAHSGINLLDNNIRADGTRVVTDAIGMHQYNGYISPTSVSKTIAYSVDTDIHPTDRKTMMVDTGIMLTGLQAGTDALAGGLTSIGSKIPFLGTVFSEANKYIEESPTTPAIENAVVSALIDQVKEMYQGWFTIQGMASVKPRDLFLLTDHITDLRGPVTVKDVVHRMDAQTGFITMISPDAVVLPHDSIIGKQMLVSLTTGPLHRLGAFLIVKGAAAGLMQAAKNKWLYSSYDGTLSKNFRKYKKIQKQLDLSEELNDLKAKSIKLLDEQHASLRFRLRTASNNRVLDSLDDYIQLDPSLEELVNKLKEIDKQKALLLKSTPTDSPTTIVTMAKNLGVLEKDSDIARRITIGANLKEKMLVFEAQLEKQIAEMAKIKGTPGQKVPGIDYGWTDSEIDEAISRWADQARAEFIAENAEDVKDVIGQLARDSDLAKELEELRIINNRLGEYGRSKVMNTRSWNVLQEPIKADMARKEELIKKINQRIKNFEVIEEDLDSLDTALRRLFTFEPVVFADGKRVSAFKAAWEGVTSTPGAIVKGTGALAKGIWDEIFTGYAERKAALELLDNPKLGWAMPTPAVKLMGSLKKLDDEINNDAEAALKKAIEEAKAAGKELNVKEKAKILEEAKDVARKLKKDLMILKLKEAAQNTITGIRLLKYMGPQAILSLAVDAAIFLLGSSLVEGHNARLRARQCVKIIPLRAGEIPYVAGIKGHQGAVIGDNPSWVDELISGLHGVQNGVLPQAGTTLLMFIASMNGVELPEWGRTAADTAYLESLKKNGSDIKVQ